ncbi:hypothetical protein [Streptomyces sp. NPDC005799]|uniref:hypothetical protein n=1 Tax=Streptomyces sp. NPDC005799 TaxID=3154678 RepID=UPI0033DE01DA
MTPSRRPHAGPVLHASAAVVHPDHPRADTRSPLLVRLRAADEAVYTREWPGPVSFLVATESTSHALALLRRTVARHGALYAAVHSTDPLVLAAAEAAALDAGVDLVANLSDLPAGPSSALTELPGAGAHFVTGRFRVLRSRWHASPVASAPAPAPEAFTVALPAPEGEAVPDHGLVVELIDV